MEIILATVAAALLAFFSVAGTAYYSGMLRGYNKAYDEFNGMLMEHFELTLKELKKKREKHGKYTGDSGDDPDCGGHHTD